MKKGEVFQGWNGSFLERGRRGQGDGSNNSQVKVPYFVGNGFEGGKPPIWNLDEKRGHKENGENNEGGGGRTGQVRTIPRYLKREMKSLRKETLSV